MQKKQESKVKMARVSLGILTGNETIVAGTPGLGAATETLAVLVEETAFHSQGQLNNGTELTQQKNAARGALETGTLKVCAALAAYATASADPNVKTLKTKYQVADWEVKKMRDMPLFTYAYTVYGDAQPFSGMLEPFASAAEVEELKTLADNFNTLLPQKRTQQSKSALSTLNLEEAIARIDVLLNDTIDVLVKPWEYKNPDFFRAYTNARIIVDAASRKTTAPPVEPPANQD